MGREGSRDAIWLGRSRETSQLDAALDELVAGERRSRSVFLFAGEPGIGKTRLAAEVGESAIRRGAAVHWGRAWEAGGAPSYWPFVQVLRSMLPELDAEALGATLGARRRDLAALLPELATSTAPEHHAPADSPRERFQLFEAVSLFFDAAAAKTPRVIVLDDLHAADPSSLLLLAFLVRERRPSRLVFIGTYRDAEARLSTEISAALLPIVREAQTFALERLDRPEVAAYLAAATGAAPTPERVDSVLRQTEGNPLFLRELLRLGSNEGRQPEGIREVVRARLALLPASVRSLLETASVLGRELALDVVAQMTESPDVEAHLAPAIDASIIEPIEGSGHVRFTHVLLREGLYRELPAPRRAELHARAARVLERSTRDASLAERAHHLLRAIPAAPVGQAVDAALRAAERAMDLLAFEDASELLERAAALLDRTDGEDERRFEVWLALGVARIRGADVERGKDLCARAAELARRLGDGERFARAVLGQAYEFAPGIRNAQLVALLEEALAMLPVGDGDLRARCMAQLAAERQPEPDPRGPMDLARAAVAMARRLGDRSTLRFTLTAASLALMLYAEPEERLALDRETLALARAASDKRLELRAHLLLMSDAWDEGAMDRADAHLRSYSQIATEFAHGAFDWTAASVHAARDLSAARFEEARDWLAKAEALVAHDATRGTSMAMMPAGFACCEERYDNLADVELQTRSAFHSVAHDLGGCIAEMAVARLHARARARDEASRRLAAVRSHPVFDRITEPAWLALLAESCRLLGDVELAASLIPLLEPRAKRFYHLGHLGPIWEPPYSRQLGLLAHTLGRFDDAVRWLTDAESAAATAGMRVHLPRLRLELAEALRARSTGDDATRARALLDVARALAREQRQTAIVRFVDALDTDGAERATRSEPPRTSNALSLRREGDYWTVSYGEHTVRLRDTRGLRVLDRLLATPDQEHHVLQLAAAAGNDDALAGDAGPVLDSEAIRSYRQRLLDLQEELEEAESFSDAGRIDRAKTEIDALTRELARAVGLGGRDRRSGNAAERARTTVQKRLKEAIRRIEDELPAIGPHLEQTVRTGLFCGYFPNGRPRSRR